MQEFHAVVVDKSLRNIEILNDLKVLSENPAGSWILYKITETEDNLAALIRKIQQQMNDGGWYFHFYNIDGSQMFVVFKDKIFETDNNPNNWTEILEYGRQNGTPPEQLDFVPNCFMDEQY